MNEIKTVIEISNKCKEHNIEAKIDESGMILSANRNGEIISKHFNLEEIGIIALNLPLDIIVDMFLEEIYYHTLQAASC